MNICECTSSLFNLLKLLSNAFRYKPYLIFFDISKCASLTSFTSGCPTPQVCVERCPPGYEFPYDGPLNDAEQKKTMRPYCTDVRYIILYLTFWVINLLMSLSLLFPSVHDIFPIKIMKSKSGLYKSKSITFAPKKLGLCHINQ